ncbi:Dabb family protein [Microbacterium aoyamense]|uniref:Dabb family protein n=1 Tax=Microbacterium aoyamense TaxID=344166 RepID=A0ABN2PW74_9MICO|nr:Dabb family protein [Microbacterium aoyamense]
MTIRHTVVFTLVHPAGSPEEAAFLDTATETLSAIGPVRDFTVSRQVSAKSDLQWQFAMVFADEADYAAYNDDPAHVAFVANRWVPEVDAFQEYDFTPR